ncbi:hypothetical protein Gohar_018538 [Gossypium harknessii]|uniref:Uncharacterized protein n=1 Tax=Gossypium harknessii TaxID=34285 RepID=A0A7J9G9C6_9ROSI|nr:hypothetical protein [Gossypium harknessii]
MEGCRRQELCFWVEKALESIERVVVVDWAKWVIVNFSILKLMMQGRLATGILRWIVF